MNKYEIEVLYNNGIKEKFLIEGIESDVDGVLTVVNKAMMEGLIALITLPVGNKANFLNVAEFTRFSFTEIKEVEQIKKLYWYELRLRGVSPGCQPMDFVEVDHKRGRWGIVAYERELSRSELSEYEMQPYKVGE